MGEAVAMVVKGDARRIGGMREEGDGRGRNDNHWRCRDEGGRSGCVKFGIRVGTIGFRKKNLNVYVIFQKIIITK